MPLQRELHRHPLRNVEQPLLPLLDAVVASLL
jgi:hypothetical protein